MTGHKPNMFWFLCWKYFAPMVMFGVFIFYCISYEPVKYGHDYTYPPWAEGLGLLMSVSSMIWVPGYALYYVLTQPGTIMEVRPVQCGQFHPVANANFECLVEIRGLINEIPFSRPCTFYHI